MIHGYTYPGVLKKCESRYLPQNSIRCAAVWDSSHHFKRRINSDEHGPKVETVRYSPVNLVGQESSKSVYSTISCLLQFKVTFLR